MVLYEYTDIVNSPRLDIIHCCVCNSEMLNKTIEYCRWDKSTKILIINFTNELSVDDKALLDTIISNCDYTSLSPNSINLTSQNYTNWKLKIDNDGVLITEEVT